MPGKAADHVDDAGLAEWGNKDLKLAVNYCKGCHGGRNSQSHTREFIGKWG